MPRFSRYSIRAALSYLVAGFALGALLLIDKAFGVHPRTWSWLPAHIEFLLLGFMLQLVMGVAYWILPRFRNPPVRGRSDAAWVALALLNAGVFTVSLSAPLGLPPLVSLLGRCSEAGSALAFALHAWPRVKPTDLPGAP